MALLKALDILACTIWLSLLYPFGLSSRPSGRQFISTYVGGASQNGHKWAIRLERLIDRAAIMLGDEPHHCYRAWLRYDLQDD